MLVSELKNGVRVLLFKIQGYRDGLPGHFEYFFSCIMVRVVRVRSRKFTIWLMYVHLFPVKGVRHSRIDFFMHSQYCGGG